MKETIEIKNAENYNKEQVAKVIAKSIYRYLLEEQQRGEDLRNIHQGVEFGAGQEQGRIACIPAAKMP